MQPSTAVRVVAFLGFTLVMVHAELAGAGGLQVSPTKIAFSATAKTGTLTLANDSSEAVRVQAVAYRWSQSAAGEIVLEPTTDIVVYPSLFTIDPGKDRAVRLGTELAAGKNEKTYRVILEELPPVRADASGGTKIRVLTRLSVPVFVAPKKSTTKAGVRGLELRDGRVAFTVANTGTVHFVLGQVRLVGRDATGEPVLDRSVNGWYVLAGGAWDSGLVLGADICPSVRRLEVEATSPDGSWTAALEVAVPSCVP